LQIERTYSNTKALETAVTLATTPKLSGRWHQEKLIHFRTDQKGKKWPMPFDMGQRDD